jgi:hypothetical protein
MNFMPSHAQESYPDIRQFSTESLRFRHVRATFKSGIRVRGKVLVFYALLASHFDFPLSTYIMEEESDLRHFLTEFLGLALESYLDTE